jgi:hypothetical protein
VIGDVAAAKRTATKLAGPDFVPVLQRKHDDAEALIREHLDAVRAVGDELLKRGRLRGSEVRVLVFGYISKRQITESADHQQGKGFAIAGIALGCVGIGFTLFEALF